MTQTIKVSKVADWLEKQVLDSSITDGTIWNKLKLSRSSFYRLKPKALELLGTRAGKAQKLLDDTKSHEIIEAAKNGLKSKTERVLYLQKQIEDIQHDLDLNQGKAIYLVVNGVVQKVQPDLCSTDKAFMRKTIKDIQSEISKIEGDYAPKKIEDVSKPTVLVPGE
jgi:hypothetical protein